MSALVVDGAAPSGIRQAVVDVPEADRDELLVDVQFASVNFLDVAYGMDRMPGAVGGVDAAGIVRRAAPDGSGPPVGARVATFAVGGAWAQSRVVSSADVALVPDGVALDLAAALPAAGVTALQAIRALGAIIDRRVLVTGASGGVGHFAVQLAAAAGAQVTALVGRPGRGIALRSLPDVDVITDLESCPEVHGIVDLVGGDVLARAFARLARHGRALAIGAASGQPTTFDLETERNRAGDRWLSPFAVSAPFGPDLSTLLDLCARHVITVPIGWRGSWRDVDDAFNALRDRRIEGKAVLEFA